MKDFATGLMTLMGAICPVTALAQHHVVNGDTENGPGTTTIFRLAGSTLSRVKTLKTGGKGVSQAVVTWLASNRQTVIKHGSEACALVSDSGSSDIAAFKGPTLPQLTRVGNYSDASLVGNRHGVALAATPDSNILFAGYPASVNIGVWLINVRLSPDERFLYIANNFSFQVTTIHFKESPLSLTFGCLARLHDPGLGQNRFAGISTEAQAGAERIPLCCRKRE